MLGLPYNWALGEFKAGLDVGEWLTERSLRPRWTVVQEHDRALGCGTVAERGQLRDH